MSKLSIQNSTSLSGLILQACERGYSDVVKDYQLSARVANLAGAYSNFFAANPELIAEFDRLGADPTEVAIDFKREVIRPGLRNSGAELLRFYSVKYGAGDEGTGLHNDSDTGADLVVVRTLFGFAEFTCQGIDRSVGAMTQIVGPGDVVVFRAGMEHSAGPPIEGPREIEGWALKL